MTDVNIQKILHDARVLLKDPKNWTTRYAARDAQGNPVPARDGNAVCWCSIGAVYKVAPSYHDYSSAMNFIELYAEDLLSGYYLVSAFNDNSRHEKVIQMFDHAIAIASEHEV